MNNNKHEESHPVKEETKMKYDGGSKTPGSYDYDMHGYFDAISTHLTTGSLTHEKAAEHFYQTKLYRGLARWQEIESKEDHCSKAKFNKLVVDYFNYVPMEDKAKVGKAVDFNYADLASFLDGWVKWEWDFLYTLRETLVVLAKHGLCEYVFDEVKCLAKEVANEIFCIEKVMTRFEANNYAPHDTSIVMKMLHCYFEKEYDGKGPIDFDI